MTIEVVETTGGQTSSAGPISIRILEDGSHTDHRLGVVEVGIPPHTIGPPQHIHHKHDETFFVISGAPSFTCGGETIIEHQARS
jgi:quercetin dioxygenase-like cupin family protein